MEPSPDSQSPVGFADLPVDFLKKVVKASSLRDCLSLRKVTPDLQNLVDTSEIQCENVNFKFERSNLTMKIGDLTLEYGGNEEAMIRDASTFLKNPKLKIGHLGLEVDRDEDAAEFLEFLGSLKSPLNVQSIQCKNLKVLYTVVQVLKVDKLEKILFDPAKFTMNQFNRILETHASGSGLLRNPKLQIGEVELIHYSYEEWMKFSRVLNSPEYPIEFRLISIKSEEFTSHISRFSNLDKVGDILFSVDLNVTEFHQLAAMEKAVRLFYCEIPSEIGLENMVHFKEISSYYYPINEEDTNLIKIRDFLVKSPRFELCSLTEFTDKHEFYEDYMYKRIDRIMSENPAYDAQTRRFSIPNSRDYFQLAFEKDPWSNVLTVRKYFENPNRCAPPLLDRFRRIIS